MTGVLEGRAALVTGGGWNIGRAVALRLARAGAAVAVLGRRRELVEESAELVRAAGGRALALVADACSTSEVEGAVAEAEASFGPLSLLAAIAGGGGGYEAVDAIDPAQWEHVLRINLFGTFQSVRAVLPSMRRAGRGAIVTCSGGGAWFPMLGIYHTAYASAKAGICRFTDQLAVELLGTGIRVNCLQPGQVWSPLDLARVEEEERRSGRPHPGRAGNHAPEEAAELALWLLSDASAPLSGRLVAVDDPWWRGARPETLRAVQESDHAFTLRRIDPFDGKRPPA